MNNSGMEPYSTALAALARKIREEDARKLKEKNGVIVCGPPASPDPDYTYHNSVTVCGQPASPDPEDTYNGTSVSPSPELINYQTVTGYGPPPSAYTVVTYECGMITLISPISPGESDTDSESSSELSDPPGSELMSTPVKQSAPNYMLESYVATPTTSDKHIRRRHLNFRDPNLMYDLEDISEDESASGEPLAQKPMTDDDVMDNESMRAWNRALANIYKSRNE